MHVLSAHIIVMVSDGLAFTDIVLLYSFVHESNVHSFFQPAFIAHADAILLHGYWAIYDPSSTSLWYAIHHTILAIAISC